MNPSAVTARIAPCLSALCAVHCVAMPLLPSAAALFAPLAAPGVEAAILAGAILLNLATSVAAARRHGASLPLWFCATAAVFFLGGQVVHSPALTVAGSLLLVASVVVAPKACGCCQTSVKRRSRLAAPVVAALAGFLALGAWSLSARAAHDGRTETSAAGFDRPHCGACGHADR